MFDNVCYDAGGRRILDGINLEVCEGETLVLLGRSGSGKTTALRMVNALLLPTSGQVVVRGESTRTCDVVQLRRATGYVIQDVGLFPHFTIARNVGLVPRLERWPEERVASRTHELLDRVGLDPNLYASRYPRQLSGGQRQRAGVARALAADPALLLFDEPFGALDPVTRRELQDQFLALRRTFGKTSLFVTHDVREALRLASRIGLLEHGRLKVLCTPEEFIASEDPEARAFLTCLNE